MPGHREVSAVRTMLKSKIHRATVTDANVEYEGSIAIDPVLMEAADILPFEQVQVLDLDNGARLTTYAIEGRPGSGDISINGAAAHLVAIGDRVIILTFTDVAEEDARTHQPRLVYPDEENAIHHTVGVPQGTSA
jgi:aspartate 1-decarboxylase